MSEHIIVCGMGDIGYRVVILLHRLGERLVAVTDRVRDERRMVAEGLGVKVLLGDARNERLLIEAGLSSARVIIAATDNDLANIEIALDARRIRPDIPVVVRLFDQDLARQLEAALHLHRALGMSALAAPSFAAAAMGDSILAGFTVGDVPYVVGRQMACTGPLADCANVGEVARLHRLQTMVLERPGQECVALPPPGEVPRPGDRLSLFGRKEDWDGLFAVPDRAAPIGRKASRRGLRRVLGRALGIWRDEPIALRAVFLSLCVLIPVTVFLFRQFLNLSLTDAIFFTITNLHGEIGLTGAGPEIKLWEILVMVLGSITIATLYSMLTDYVVGARLRKLLGGRPMPKKGHVVVVGMGQIGYRVTLALREVGVPLVAVDSDPDAPFLATVRTLAPVVIGDARLPETLERAGLGRARAVVAATSDDAVNLGIGLAARRESPSVRTVVRLFDADFARKVESALGIDAALGASRIAAPTFAASALYPDVAKAFIVQDRLLILRLCRAGADWSRKKPTDLEADEGSPVRILMRNGELPQPGGAERPLAEGEEVLAALWRKLEPAPHE